MEIIDLSKIRQARAENQAEAAVRDMVEEFRMRVQSALRFDDGRTIDLRSALFLLTRYWGTSETKEPVPDDLELLRLEIEGLEEERDYWAEEVNLAKTRHAMLCCPFAELDILEHPEGVRAWVEMIGFAHHHEFHLRLRQCGRNGRPVKKGRSLHVFGTFDAQSWRKVGRVSEKKAAWLGWRPFEDRL